MKTDMHKTTTICDKSQCTTYMYDCSVYPNPVHAPTLSGSPDLLINGKPGLRVGNNGIHASCYPADTWQVIEGSPNVSMNGKPSHRLDDEDQHSGEIGRMMEGSPNVFMNGMGGKGSSEKMESDEDVIKDAI